jgi:hypothetical protein
MLTLCLIACAKRPIADPGGPVGLTRTATPGAFVVTDCPDGLDGDDGGVSPLYLVDPSTGAVTRWLPDTLPGGASMVSSASTPALFFESQLKLWSLSPDGTVRVIDESPGHEESRFSSDGAHRMVIVEKTVEWRTLDGKVERTFVLPDFPNRIFPAPSGERAVTQIRETTSLVDARGATTLLDHQQLIAAAWSPDGSQVALATEPLAYGATPVDNRAFLWRAKLDGTDAVQLSLPPRPGPDWLSRLLDLPQPATAVRALVWTQGGLVIMSNHESECWSGGRDIPGGCYWALYRVAPEGGEVKRISPRAFRCQSLFQLHALAQ